MRPIPIEEEFSDAYRKVIIAAPDNDLMNDNIRPIEAVVGPVVMGDEVVNTFIVKILLEERDLEKIEEGQHHFWLLVYGKRLQPFAVSMEV